MTGTFRDLYQISKYFLAVTLANNKLSLYNKIGISVSRLFVGGHDSVLKRSVTLYTIMTLCVFCLIIIIFNFFPLNR